jgi:hypothetical protein
MAEQFVNQEETKVVDETVSDATTEKRLDNVAEKAAEKSTKTVQHYDKEHSIFSK